jgi:hypothetical protein
MREDNSNRRTSSRRELGRGTRIVVQGGSSPELDDLVAQRLGR